MRTLFILLTIITFTRCANQSMPQGGPKDEIPPKMETSTPVHEQINFKDNSIKIEFDEFVQLNNPDEQIIITPKLKEKPEFLINKKTITINIKEKLMDNTTYSISFREAVQDITEKNPAKSLRLAFSTGDYIDTLKIEGKVYDLLSNKPIKDAIVSLYFNNDTTNILNNPPVYLAITNDSGKFSIQNLKADRYKLFVLQDQNSNNLLDYEDEKYGFKSGIINLTSDVDDLEIPIYKNDLRKLKLISARNVGRYFTLKYNKAIKTINFDNDNILYNINENNPTEITIFNNLKTDSLQSIINTIDSTNISSTDTLWIKFEDTQRKPEEYNFTIKNNPIIENKWVYQGILKFNKPTTIYDKDSLYIQLDTIQNITVDSIIKSNNNNFIIYKSLINYINDSINKNNLKLTIAHKSFLSIENDTIETKTLKIPYKKKLDLGTIEIEAITNQQNYTIQLLDKERKVLSETKNAKYNFNNLEPGNYSIRVLIDSNNNGVWEKGNLEKDTQPEEVYNYINDEGINSIPLRANFIIGPLILRF